MKELMIGGHSSLCGGADIEVLYLVDLLRQNNIDVTFVPMFGCDERVKTYEQSIGCKYQTYHPGVFKDKIVASWCNGEFLKKLPEIMHHGKPQQVCWFNCMCWNFADEITAHRQKWIDKFGFVSKHQESILRPKYEAVGPFQKFEGYTPYFNPDNTLRRFNFIEKDQNDFFCMGRISRDDPAKFAPDMWKMFYKVCSPIPTKTFVLGFSDKIKAKIGEPPVGLDWMVYAPGAIPAANLYKKLHVMMHKVDNSNESLGFVVFEAYANGVVPIVEDAYAMPTLVIDGVTGFRCKSSDEFSYRASQLAFDSTLRKKMAKAGNEFLRDELCNKDKCIKPWLELLS